MVGQRLVVNKFFFLESCERCSPRSVRILKRVRSHAKADPRPGRCSSEAGVAWRTAQPDRPASATWAVRLTRVKGSNADRRPGRWAIQWVPVGYTWQPQRPPHSNLCISSEGQCGRGPSRPVRSLGSRKYRAPAASRPAAQRSIACATSPYGSRTTIESLRVNVPRFPPG
jgi:hypothetical protein